jgi:hypothetical protein
MVDRHQPRLFRIPIGGQITVPGQKRWVYIFQEGSREGGDDYLLLCAFVPASDFPDAPGSDSVDRRLAKPTGMNRSGGIGRDGVAVPAPRSGKVARKWSGGVEDDVGHFAGFPLSIEEGYELSGGTANI